MSRLRQKAAEAWEEERQMNALNESLARHDQREKLACQIAGEQYGSDDVESSTPEDNRGAIAVESVDGGYWVSARLWVDADEVEERMDVASNPTPQ